MSSTGVNIVLEFRFYRDEDGVVYTDASFDYPFWQRYLLVFSQVNIIARARQVPNSDVSDKWKQVTGDRVSFTAIPYYHGVGELVRKMPRVLKEVKRIIASSQGAYIFRMPSIIGALFFMSDRHMGGRAFGVEMVGDPEEVFGSLSPLYRPVGRAFVKNIRSIIGRARAVAYVERRILPAKYPASNPQHVYYFSSINLPDGAIAAAPRTFGQKEYLELISIGALDQMYKGPDILLNAILDCKQKGMEVRLTWIGGGLHLEKMRELAANLGLDGQVQFAGMVTEREKIDAALDKADIFVLASRTEGLPRAMIEAMARGLPCIGSDVGGIPELLPGAYMFAKERVDELSALLQACGRNTSELERMSAANIETARRYANSRLDKERIEFYKSVSG